MRPTELESFLLNPHKGIATTSSLPSSPFALPVASQAEEGSSPAANGGPRRLEERTMNGSRIPLAFWFVVTTVPLVALCARARAAEELALIGCSFSPMRPFCVKRVLPVGVHTGSDD